MRDALKRGQLAQSLGCNIETIRYYENIGLIGPADRSASGHRLYFKADADRLQFILRLRQLGFSIGDVRSLLETINSGEYSCREIAKVAEQHILTIRTKINDLEKLERNLTEITSQCHRGNTPDCAVIDALSET